MPLHLVRLEPLAEKVIGETAGQAGRETTTAAENMRAVAGPLATQGHTNDRFGRSFFDIWPRCRAITEAISAMVGIEQRLERNLQVKMLDDLRYQLVARANRQIEEAVVDTDMTNIEHLLPNRNELLQSRFAMEFISGSEIGSYIVRVRKRATIYCRLG